MLQLLYLLVFLLLSLLPPTNFQGIRVSLSIAGRFFMVLSSFLLYGTAFPAFILSPCCTFWLPVRRRFGMALLVETTVSLIGHFMRYSA